MLSVIDFAFAAPVVVQKRELRVSVVDAANDGAAMALRRGESGKWPTNAADRTNANAPRSSDSGYWRKHVPRQHHDTPRSRTNSNGLPEPSNPSPPIDLNNRPPPSPSLPPVFDPPSPSTPPGFGPTSPSVPPGFESTSRLPTSQVPKDGLDPFSPSFPHGNTHLRPFVYKGTGSTDNSDR